MRGAPSTWLHKAKIRELLRHATIGPRAAVGSDPIAPSVLEAMALLEGLTPSLDGGVYLGISLHVRIPHFT